LVGYDQKADIWSIGTLCYEMLIGRSAFNSKSMQELVQKVESGSYVIPTFLSKEVVSFLNAMLQYNAQKRLSANELARHHFLTKNVRDFEPIDVRKVSNKVNQNNLHVNIKRNQTIWSIFNQEDEKKLINIPGNYLSPMSEIKEEEEYVSGPQDNKRRNTEKIPRLNKNLYEIFPQENIDQYEINKKNTQKYQGYGVGINGLNAYNNTNNQGYGFGNFRQQAPHMASNFPYPFPMVVPASVPASIPSIEKVEPEDGPKILRGGRQGPIMQIPSFGVPSPNEESNADKGYCFSSGIFQPNVSESEEDSEYTCVGGGYGYGYGYESNEK
jgi:serine/threonine protein kinase